MAYEGLSFGELLRRFRRRYYTQGEFGALTGFSTSYISKLETGSRLPLLATAKQLAQALLLDEQEERILLASVTAAEIPRVSKVSAQREDWGEAPIRGEVYGRELERESLAQAILRHPLVAVLGLGGVGKTSLVAITAEKVKGEFEYIFWRSLYNAPPLERVLASCLQFVDQQRTDLPQTADQQVLVLLSILREHRCLLILDNVDAILDGKKYRSGYEAYGELFKRIGGGEHKSCLLITSRIKPVELVLLSGQKTSPAFSMTLKGLRGKPAQYLLEDKGVYGSDGDYELFVERYSGNPLALQLVAEPIRELFAGNVGRFLKENPLVFGDVNTLLEQQLLSLQEHEWDLLFWLAVERGETTLEALQKEVYAAHQPAGAFFDAVDGLLRRSLLEMRGDETFGLQPVILEYVTSVLISRMSDEILAQRPRLLTSHALLQAQAKDYVREAQVRLILQPLIERLLASVGKEGLERACRSLLALARQTPTPGYTAGNLLNLLLHLEGDCSGLDFSHLPVWQAYLQDTELSGTNFAYSDLSRTVFPHDFDAVLALECSSNGQWVATATGMDQVVVWEYATGVPLSTCQHDAVSSIAFGPDSALLATGGEDGVVRLWNVQDGQPLQLLHAHTQGVRSLAFSPDGKLLASGSSDQSIRLWEVRSGRLRSTLHVESGVWSLVFSPDGDLLVCSSADQSIRVWDLEVGAVRMSWQEHSTWPIPLAFSPDGKTLASGSSDCSIRLWEVSSGHLLHILQGHTGWVMTLAFSPDGKTLASGSSDQSIRLWEVSSGTFLRLLRGHERRVWSVRFHPGGEALVSGGDDRTIRFWNSQNGQLLRSLYGSGRAALSVAFSPDGEMLASACEGTGIKLWETEHYQPLAVLRAHNRGTRAVAFSPDGALLASGGDDGAVCLWSLQALQIVQTWSAHQSYIWTVAWGPDGTLLASGSDDQTIRFWDWQTGERRGILPGQLCWGWTVAFSPDGQTLACGSDDFTIRLIDVASGRVFRKLQGHTGWVRTVAFSPDGELLASGGDDRVLRLWQVKSGELLFSLAGHTHHIWSVAFSPDGKGLASGSHDTTVRLWDVYEGRLLSTLAGHTYAVASVAFHPNGTLLASGGYDGTIHVWNGQTGEVLAVLRNRPYEGMNIYAATGLTQNQRATLKRLGAIEVWPG